MKIESRSTIHAGVGFILTPFALERARVLAFQQSLLSIDSNFARFEFDETKFVAARLSPTPLEVRLANVGPMVGQLVIVAAGQVPSRDSFIVTADLIAEAYEQVWNVPNRQVINVEVTLRDLYDTERPHAFMELWEQKLNRTSVELQAFQQPLVGGGLRFVFAPQPPDVPVIDLKMESKLDDPRKIFIEISSNWQEPGNPGLRLIPSERVRFVDRFATERAAKWIAAETKQ